MEQTDGTRCEGETTLKVAFPIYHLWFRAHKGLSRSSAITSSRVAFEGFLRTTLRQWVENSLLSLIILYQILPVQTLIRMVKVRDDECGPIIMISQDN